ncbi:hypothetical protein EDD86DRAFT_187862 [Gorgonomyces haynaldii]|nr:hypothetical protein EDD86DRAFT_187862 [Gorgonomyces haynaldii]
MGKELQESYTMKLMAMRWVFVALAVNGLFLYAINSLMHTLTLDFGGEILVHAAPVVIEVWMHISHYVTSMALYDGLGHFVGYLLTRPDGFSLTACGYVQSSFLEKLQFADKLSFRSTVRKFLQRVSYIFIFHNIVLILTIFCSTALTVTPNREDRGVASCIIYGQQGKPTDRGWPTIQVAMGLGELIFGTSLGYPRSEMAVDNTTFLMSPQLVDAISDGQAIIGLGYQTSLFTSCSCIHNVTVSELVDAGLDATNASLVVNGFVSIENAPGLVNVLSYSGDTMQIMSLVTGVNVCGNSLNGKTPLPVCFTKFDHHKRAMIYTEMITDGTTASVAPKLSTLRETKDKADMYWMYMAYKNIFGGDFSVIPTPSSLPGATNPLFWWTTPDMRVVSASAIDAGMETLYAIIGRSAIQRTFSVSGTTCLKNELSLTAEDITMSRSGAQVGIAFISVQFIVTFVAMLGFVPWFILQNPIGPGIRLVMDRIYFTVMTSGPMSSGAIKGMNGSMESHYIWSKLDLVVRIGEAKSTAEDPEFGTIIVDKPKYVTALSRAKCYN